MSIKLWNQQQKVNHELYNNQDMILFNSKLALTLAIISFGLALYSVFK